MKFFIIILSIFSLSTLAGELQVKNYLKLQDALAIDDFSVATQLHEGICKNELGKYKETYKDCGKKFKNIEELRNSFKQLSNLYIANTDKKDMKDLIVAECPMVKAKWIQPKGGIRNPYYGKGMLECGQQI